MPAKLVKKDEKLGGAKEMMSVRHPLERPKVEGTHARDRTVKYLVRNVEMNGL
jgi:hypothetical protein